MLTKKERDRLLKIVRETMETYVKKRRVPEFLEDDPKLLKKCGAFVTLKKKEGLRGCIGHIVSDQPLYELVKNLAIASSTQDPRFPPVSPDELKDITIEISVLSSPKRISNIDEFKLGKHGVIVKMGFREGVFLPQVAIETGWGKEEFFSNLCSYKTGLPSDAWKDKDTELYIFSAEVFKEK